MGQALYGVSGVADIDIDWAEALVNFTGAEVVSVGILDTGIAIDHPEFVDSEIQIHSTSLRLSHSCKNLVMR